jgi:hypothetical protein
VNIELDGVKTSGQATAEVFSDVSAKGDIDAKLKNIETKP